MYRCAKCDKPVVVLRTGGAILRPCGHTTAAIIAEMKAKVEGYGGIR